MNLIFFLTFYVAFNQAMISPEFRTNITIQTINLGLIESANILEECNNTHDFLTKVNFYNINILNLINANARASPTFMNN